MTACSELRWTRKRSGAADIKMPVACDDRQFVEGVEFVHRNCHRFDVLNLIHIKPAGVIDGLLFPLVYASRTEVGHRAMSAKPDL
jgi:hypothetical protein